MEVQEEMSKDLSTHSAAVKRRMSKRLKKDRLPKSVFNFMALQQFSSE